MGGLQSVDAALLLATVLQQEGPLRVTDAAARLGVSVSSAHRLLTALEHRDFAVQASDRRYGPGPLLRPGPASGDAVADLRAVALPHMRRLVAEWGETVHLAVLVGVGVRFVATVECGHVLRVGDRTGRTLPAHLTSAGKAVLARRAPADLDSLLAGLDEDAAQRLTRELRTVRRRGYAVNDQATKSGLTAVGVALPQVPGLPPAALALAMPRVRFTRTGVPAWAADLTGTAARIAAELAELAELAERVLSHASS